MAIAMQRTTFHQLLALISVLFQCVLCLPGGCGGTLEILDISSPTYNDTVWACAGIERSSIFGGDALLLAASNQDNVTNCADYCATTSFPDGLMAGIWDSDNSTCECWYIGDLNYYDLPAASPGVTFIDFFEAWNPGGRPSKAQNWGVFTCPAGAESGWADAGNAAYCGPLTLEPAQPALAELGIIGDCWGFCLEYPGVEWVLSRSPSDCNCYGDLAGLKVTLNYTPTDFVIDYYDFEPHSTSSSTFVTTKTSPSTSSHSTKSSTSVASRRSTTSALRSTTSPVTRSTPRSTLKSSLRSTSKSSSHTTIKSTTKKTSTSSEVTSPKSSSHSPTSTAKTISKTTSSKVILRTDTSSSKTSSPSKSSTHSTTKSA
ncbi:uncharacterized protein LY89DRAFT_200309 [Mollisia scopiformis]|uniref:Uncharacterized protein n=1 Tax=Mollisia scopiformis TaxID=149040 RepID=A0A194WYL9_MOLSC|nr:uncharacterized protein LY89DRAFT_200309 [Mollisia scopiformis]KUJ13061.1 hypothetical protein LY89DRAFT_200309 [Mollisia scopiformis]